jgi:hypothetical protein
MKKTYIQPSIEANECEVDQILMTSLPVDPTTETKNQMGRDLDFDDED